MINTVAILDADTGELVLFTRRLSDDTAWNDAGFVIEEYFDRIYEDFEEGASKDFVVFFKSDDVPADKEVLPPSRMIATLIIEELVTRRCVTGAAEDNYSEEIFPYKQDRSDITPLPDGVFPSWSKIKHPRPIRSLMEIKSRFTEPPFNGRSDKLKHVLFSRYDHVLFPGLNDGLVAYTQLPNQINKVENEWTEPRRYCSGILACKWLYFKEHHQLDVLKPDNEKITTYFNRLDPGFGSWRGTFTSLHKDEESKFLKKAAWVKEMIEGDLWSLLLANCLYDELCLFQKLLMFGASDAVFLAHGIFHHVNPKDFNQLSEAVEIFTDDYSELAPLQPPGILPLVSNKLCQDLELFYRTLEQEQGVEFDYLRRIGFL